MSSGQELGDVERIETATSRSETNVPTTHSIGLGGTTPREISRGKRTVMSPAKVAINAHGRAGTKNSQVSYSSSMNFMRRSEDIHSEDFSSEERMYGLSNPSSLLPRNSGNIANSPQERLGSARLPGWRLQCPRQPKHLTDDHGVVDIALDPTHENHEFDSIMESEDFTMISISTLPSAKQQQPSHSQERLDKDQGTSSTHQQQKPGRRSPGAADSIREDDPEMQRSAESSAELRPHPRPHLMKFEDLSRTLDLSSSSFPYCNHNNRDAMIKPKDASSRLSSPALSISSRSLRHQPSPERSLYQSAEMSSRSAQAVSRGIAVQGVWEVLDNHESSRFPIRQAQSSVPLGSPIQQLDDAQSGFGAATEDYETPSAGLRNVAEWKEASMFLTPEKARNLMLAPQLVEQRVDYPKLPIEPHAKQFPKPEGNEKHDQEERINRDVEPASELSSHSRLDHEESISTGQYDVEDTMLVREAQWQREREATSRQIQEANTSQVIVIESDDSGAEENIAKSVEKEDDEDDEEMDVWQAEARYSRSGRSKTPTKVLGGLCVEVPLKPEHSKLPSPLQRHSKTNYSGQTGDDDQQDLLWRPVLKHPRTPIESLMRKKTKYDDSAYSVLSDCIGQADRNRAASIEHQSRSSSVEVWENLAAAEQVEEDNGGDEDAALCERSPSAIVAECGQPGKMLEVDFSDQRRCAGQESTIRRSSVSAQPTYLRAGMPSSSWFNHLSSTVPYLQALIRGVGSAVADTKETSTERSMAPEGIPVSEPLSIYLPWKTVHYRRLRAVYLSAKRNHQLYRVNPSSSAIWLLGRDVESMGWKKRISEWEVGVVDAFLEILATEGVDDKQVAPLRKLLKPIDAAEVAKRIFSLWCAEVQRGKAPLGKAVAGIFDKRYEWRRQAVLQEAAEREEPKFLHMA